MTGRTLEEIEALATEATLGPWGFFKHDCKELPSIDSFEITFQNKYGTAWLQSSNTHGVTMDRDMSRKETAANAALLASARDLLAIAQGQREELKAAKHALQIACEDLLVKSEQIKLFEGRITSLATLPEEEFDAACGPENGTQVQFGIRAGFAAGWKYSVQKLIGTKK